MADKFMLDSMIFDKLAKDREALSVLKSKVSSGIVDIVVTHIQEDQLRHAPGVKRGLFEEIPRRAVATADFVIGESRLGLARLGDGAALEALRGSSWDHRRSTDALIGSTALAEGAVLVTEDGRLTRKAQRRLGRLEVWNWRRFRDHIMCGS